MASTLAWAAVTLLKRDEPEPDPDDDNQSEQKMIEAAWSLFILVMLLITALFSSYLLQTRKIQAVHETVMSIFAGMIIGLILRLDASDTVLKNVSFNQQMFFNLLLPPIILASGYELHQTNFFRNIGSILTFAFAGTFISAVVLGLILFLWTRLNLDGVNIDFVDALSVGATLSATDPVTILAIFNAYKVDPKLYTVIFGESILNDAIAIVLFETARRYKTTGTTIKVFSVFEAIGNFTWVFFGSLIIGVMIGMLTSLVLKFTYLRRYPKTESCIIILIAYASYFFPTAIRLSGIVSLLFCGICLKHYAYLNMSRRTQLTTKFIFQVTAQLSENFIFIYLGLSLFTERDLVFKPLFILMTTVGICVARWCAVFPLSKFINWFIRYNARRRGDTEPAEIPYSHQVMLFWAGLRGAVGVALAAGLADANGAVLRATILVVVVLTVIIFGGTTARMLEILGIRTGVVEEIDSDDEFDIEYIGAAEHGTSYSRKSGAAFGHNPRRSSVSNGGFALGTLPNHSADSTSPTGVNGHDRRATYNSGRRAASSASRHPHSTSRHNSRPHASLFDDSTHRGLLSPDQHSASGSNTPTDLVSSPIDPDPTDDAFDELDLPPAARRAHHLQPPPTTGAGGNNSSVPRNPRSSPSPHFHGSGNSITGPSQAPTPPISTSSPYPTSGSRTDSRADQHASGSGASDSWNPAARVASATGAISQLISGISEDPAGAFRQIDEGFIKPRLLLDPGSGSGGGGGGGGAV